MLLRRLEAGARPSSEADRERFGLTLSKCAGEADGRGRVNNSKIHPDTDDKYEAEQAGSHFATASTRALSHREIGSQL
jgi:hypothetical protein